METVACLGIGVVYLLLKTRNEKKQQAIAQGVEDNGKKGDQGLDFMYNLWVCLQRLFEELVDAAELSHSEHELEEENWSCSLLQ